MNNHHLFLISFVFIASFLLGSESRQASHQIIAFTVESYLNHQKLVPVFHYYRGRKQPIQQNVFIIPAEKGSASKINNIELYIPLRLKSYQYTHSTIFPNTPNSILNSDDTYLMRQ